MFLCHVMEYIHVHMRGVQYREMMDIDLHVHVLCIHVHIQCIQAQKQNYSPPLLPNEDNPFNQAGHHNIIIIMAYMQFSTSYIMLLYIGMYIHTWLRPLRCLT